MSMFVSRHCFIYYVLGLHTSHLKISMIYVLHVFSFRFTCICFVVLDGSSSDTLRKLSEDSSRKHLSGEFNHVSNK